MLDRILVNIHLVSTSVYKIQFFFQFAIMEKKLELSEEIFYGLGNETKTARGRYQNTFDCEHTIYPISRSYHQCDI